MNQNIFQEIQDQKNHLLDIARKARSYGWIDEKREKQIIDKINNDTLTLGVIGQMKCGKSTFLNAFVFGDTVLPAATTPMTAALSLITYGPEKKLEVEFYSNDEWMEQQMLASTDINEVKGNENKESRVKAAKELVAKAVNIPGNIKNYLGKIKTDTLSNLIEYVGADGKFVSITKSVKIFYPHDYLKGVEIVDTPGFNDPIVSREERTKEFLKKADVVLLMLYAGRAFDTTDRTILFKNVRECGIGKVLIGVNKYDIPYGNGETEERIISTVKEQISKACASSADEAMVALIKEQDPILLSAEMSLMSQLPMAKVKKDFATSWNNTCTNFEISSQMEMAEKSRIQYLIQAVKDVIQRDKMDVLLKKPYNAIHAAAMVQKEKLEAQLRELEMLIDNLQQPDEELEDRLAKIKKATRKIERKLDSLGDDIELSYSNLIRKGRNEMEDEVDAACRKLDHEIDNLGRMAEAEDIKPKWDSILNILMDRTLKRSVERLADDTKRQLNSCIREFCEEIEDLLIRYIEEFEARDFMKKLSLSISENIDKKNIFEKEEEAETETEETSFWETVGLVIALPFIPYIYLGGRVWTAITGNGEMKRDLHQRVEEFRHSFDVEPMLSNLKERKVQIIELIKRKVMDELLNPMQRQLEEILTHTEDKEKQLSVAKSNLTNVSTQLLNFNEAFNEVFK